MKDYTFDVRLDTDNGVSVILEEHPDVGFTLMIPDKGNDDAFTWLINNMSSVARASMTKLTEEVSDE